MPSPCSRRKVAWGVSPSKGSMILDGDASEGAVVDLQLGGASVDVLELVDGLKLELRAQHLLVAGGGDVGVVNGPAKMVSDGFVEDRHGATPRRGLAADDSERGGAWGG